MEIPEICLKATQRKTRKRKVEEEIDPDYDPNPTSSPVTSHNLRKRGPRTIQRSGPPTNQQNGPQTTQQSGPQTTQQSGPQTTQQSGPQTTLQSGPRKIQPKEKKKIKRSATINNMRRRPRPTLNFIDRPEYSIENWQKKAFERRESQAGRISKKTLEKINKFEEVIANRGQVVENPGRKTNGGVDDESGDEETFNRYASFAEGEYLGDEFDFSNLPKFVMGAGKGEPGGPPKYEFKSLWNYQLSEMENDEQNLDDIKANFPWELSDSSQTDMVPEILAIVACFTVGQRLDLKQIAMGTRNVEYNPDRFAPLIMRIREPKSTALIFRTGRIIVAGTRSEAECKVAARKYARIIQRFGYRVEVFNFHIQNIAAQANLKFRVRLNQMSRNKFYGNLSYEPEMFPGLGITLEYPRMKVIIFCSGSVLMTGAKSEDELRLAMDAIYPLARMYAH